MVKCPYFTISNLSARSHLSKKENHHCRKICNYEIANVLTGPYTVVDFSVEVSISGTPHRYHCREMAVDAFVSAECLLY